jgi:hypothetical protein
MNVDPYLDLPALHDASDSESEDWDCLFVREDADPETESLPDLAPVSDSESESGDEGELRWSESEDKESEDDGFAIQKVVDKGDEPCTSKYDSAFVAGVTGSSDRNTEIYDSGASRHITPCKEKLINYESIVPRDFKSANNGNFQAIGKGDMLLKVPGPRNTTLEVLLKDVLYSPRVGVTLIAISKVAQHGHSVVFTERYCKILSSKGKVLGIIPQCCGLY